MAIPQLRAEGVDQTGGSTAFTINFTGFTFAAGDILEISLCTDGWVPSLTTANGWALAQDPLGNTASVTTNGGVAGAGQVGMFVYWKMATGATSTTDPPPVFAAPSAQSGTCWALEPNSYSGARSGNPWHKIATSILTTAATAIASDAQTSSLANCLFMTRVGGGGLDDSTFPNWAMSGSSGPSGAQVSSGWHAPSGNKCTFTGTDGGYATAGGPHSGTCSFATAAKQARISLIMASLAEPASATANASVQGAAGATAISATAPESASAATVGDAGATAGSATAKINATAAAVGDSGATTGLASDTSPPLTATAAAGGGSGALSIAATIPSTAAAALRGGDGAISSSGIPAANVSAAVAGGSGAIAASVTSTHSASAAMVGGSGAISAASTAPSGLGIGRFGIRQKANTTTTPSPVTTYAVYPAWQASHLYTLSDGVRVTNAGNIYELTFPSTSSSGTSAASGGPTGTGAGIVDGTCQWNYLGPGTGACDTQPSGSFFVASVAWGRDATGGAAPADNKGNAFSLVSKHFYTSFPSSSQATYTAAVPATGGTGHTLSAAYGSGNDGGLDECTAIIGEIIGGTLLKDHSYIEAAPVSNDILSAPVTTTGPAVLIAFWWLNGTVRASGTNHQANPSNGFVAIPEATALMEIGPSGAGEVQVATHYRVVSTAGTYQAKITTNGGEGSAVHLLAIQASDPPPAATATAAITGGAGAISSSAAAVVRDASAMLGGAGSILSSVTADHQAAAAILGVAGAMSGSATVTGGASPATLNAAILGGAGVILASAAAAVQAIGTPQGNSGAVAVAAQATLQAIASPLGAAGVAAASATAPIAATGAVRGAEGLTSSAIQVTAGPQASAALAGAAGAIAASVANRATSSAAIAGAEGSLVAVQHSSVSASASAAGASGATSALVIAGSDRVLSAAVGGNAGAVASAGAAAIAIAGSFHGDAGAVAAIVAVRASVASFRRLSATLGMTGKLYGLLQLEGGTLIDLIGPFTIEQGDDVDFLLTVTDDTGARQDLTGFAIELQVKPNLGDPDPPTIAKSIAGGTIIPLDQTDPATRGQATFSFSSVETNIAPRLYWLDVVTINPAGKRGHPVAPRQITIGGVVNPP